jgi:DNA-directed RNA polymerase omega subunit
VTAAATAVSAVASLTERPTPTAAEIAAAGITYPPIDELLTKATSKYALAIFAAKRARQINDYYSRLGRGTAGVRRAAGRARCPRRSRCPSRCARSTPACSSTPKASEGPGRRFRRALTMPSTAGSPAPTTATPRVVLGVGGGIAAYKACELLRRMRSPEALGADVTVVPTAAALNFVGAATFEALSGHPVAVGVFSDVPAVAHVATGQQADLVVIAPATADLMARAAAGMADDLLTATLLVTARCPCSWHRPCTPRCGTIPPPSPTSPPCGPAGWSSSTRPSAG